MDSEEAPPPPYSAVDPLLTEPPTAPTGTINGGLHLRGENAPLSVVTSNPGVGASGPSSSSSAAFPSPANFESAVAYFAERPQTVLDNDREILHHHMTIFPRSQAKDFPRRPRCWNSRTDEITQQDWDMFLRYLFPPHLGLASASGHLSRQLRAQIQRDRKDRPQETDEQRRLRITAVVTEWNQCFFEPRAARLMFSYVMDPGNAPSSSLCPKCYPAATRANQDSRSSSRTQLAFGRGRQSLQPSTPPAMSQSPSPQTNNGFPPAHPYPQLYGMVPVPYAPYGPVYYPPPGPQNAYPARAYPPPHPYNYQQHYQWGWNNRPYPPQSQSSNSSKGGPLGWISQLASQAQKYGERISEQAQQYGDQISAHADYYGRQVEEQAIAHGRWLEEQAGLSGRKSDAAYPGYPGQPVDPRYQFYPYNAYHYPQYNNPSANMNPTTAAITTTTSPTATTTTTTTTNTNMKNDNITTNQNTITYPTPTPRLRSSSVDSAASDSSLTSIDSLSTTSELSSSDLATVRAQLLSLEDHHDRELYETAVGLRRQLDIVRESRQSCTPGRSGWGQYPHQNNDGRGGVWNRSWTERRAIKEEMRATKKAFRDVLRRAREEQREQRRNKRLRRRQQQQRLQELQREAEAEAQAEAARSREVSLEQRLENLDLEKAKKHESQPTVRSSASFPSTARSISSSEASDISSISTPSTASLHEGDNQQSQQQQQNLQNEAQTEVRGPNGHAGTEAEDSKGSGKQSKERGEQKWEK